MARQYSIAELKKQANEILDDIQITGEPAFITSNGRVMTVLVDADEYLTQLQALREFERIFRDMRDSKPKATFASTPAGGSGDAGEGATPKGRVAWRCSICGYIVEAEELPDDFKCPICGQGKEVFERIYLED